MPKSAANIILFLAAFVVSAHLSAQHRLIRKIDSLQLLLKSEKNDSVRVITLNTLSDLYQTVGQTDSATQCAVRGLKLAYNTSFPKGMTFAFTNLGLINHMEGNFAEALKYHKLSLSVKLQVLKAFKGDTNTKAYRQLHQAVANSCNNSGGVYRDLGNYPEALKEFFTSLRIRERLLASFMKNPRFDSVEYRDLIRGLASSHNNIGMMHLDQHNFTDAEKAFLASLDLKKQTNDKSGIANTLHNLGNLYHALGRFKEAEQKFREALSLREEIGDVTAVASGLANLGNIQYLQGNYDEALSHLRRALQMSEATGNKVVQATAHNNIGVVLTALKKVQEARAEFQKAIAIATATGKKETLVECYLARSKADSLAGDFRSAFQSYKLHVAYRDSMLNEENTKKTVQAQMQYEFDKKEGETKAAQAKKDALAAEEKRRQQIILWCVAGGLSLVLAFAVFIFRAYREKKKANIEILKQKDVIEEKQKEILDSIHYARRIQHALMKSEMYVAKSLNRLK